MEEASHLNRFLSDIFKVADDILGLSEVELYLNNGAGANARISLLVSARHVPGSIYHSFVAREELIQIPDTLCVLVQ